MRNGTLDSAAPRRHGFTLVEVVVALIVLELGVLGVLGTLALASETLRRAERLERATSRVEALVDSLSAGSPPDTVMEAFADVRISWTVDDGGRLDLLATDEQGGTLLRIRSRVPVP